MIRRLIFSALTVVLTVGGDGCKAPPGVQIAILMYHRIGDAPGDLWTVSPSDFEAQIQYLKQQNYESILPQDLADGNALPEKPAIITFDDGYLSVKTYAEPVLQKYGFRGVAYLITRYVADDEAGRIRTEGNNRLTWPEVREMRARGTIVFGGHSHTHPRLDKMKDPFPEIETCFREIVEKGGFKPDSFCYPYGSHNKATERAVRRVGFTTAVTAGEEVADTGHLELLTLPRLWVRGGKHDFKVDQLTVEHGEVRCRLQHKGIPIPISVHLASAGNPPVEIWQDVEELGPGPAEWSWKLPPPVGDPKSLRVEVWDKNRFFRLFAYP